MEDARIATGAMAAGGLVMGPLGVLVAGSTMAATQDFDDIQRRLGETIHEITEIENKLRIMCECYENSDAGPIIGNFEFTHDINLRKYY